MSVTIDRVKYACSDCVCVVDVEKGVKRDGRIFLRRSVRRAPQERRWLRTCRLHLPRLTIARPSRAAQQPG